MTTIYLFHGLMSSPKSVKLQHLKSIAEDTGYTVDIPDYEGVFEADERINHFLSRDNLAVGDCILVGSSMGGYVATVLSKHMKPSGLFLMAPAFYLPLYTEQTPHPYADKIEIIHGWHDDLVPHENSIRFAKEHSATLHLVDGQHNLRENTTTIGELFKLFLTIK